MQASNLFTSKDLHNNVMNEWLQKPNIQIKCLIYVHHCTLIGIDSLICTRQVKEAT